MTAVECYPFYDGHVRTDVECYAFYDGPSHVTVLEIYTFYDSHTRDCRRMDNILHRSFERDRLRNIHILRRSLRPS